MKTEKKRIVCEIPNVFCIDYIIRTKHDMEMIQSAFGRSGIVLLNGCYMMCQRFRFANIKIGQISDAVYEPHGNGVIPKEIWSLLVIKSYKYAKLFWLDLGI